jgi:hypothetical protein
MLIIESARCHGGMVIIMSEINVLAASVKGTLLEISNQASALATGLQNASPGDKPDQPPKPNKSIDYLFGISGELAGLAEKCEKFLTSSLTASSDNPGK